MSAPQKRTSRSAVILFAVLLTFPVSLAFYFSSKPSSEKVSWINNSGISINATAIGVFVYLPKELGDEANKLKRPILIEKAYVGLEFVDSYAASHLLLLKLIPREARDTFLGEDKLSLGLDLSLFLKSGYAGTPEEMNRISHYWRIQKEKYAERWKRGFDNIDKPTFPVIFFAHRQTKFEKIKGKILESLDPTEITVDEPIISE